MTSHLPMQFISQKEFTAIKLMQDVIESVKTETLQILTRNFVPIAVAFADVNNHMQPIYYRLDFEAPLQQELTLVTGCLVGHDRAFEHLVEGNEPEDTFKEQVLREYGYTDPFDFERVEVTTSETLEQLIARRIGTDEHANEMRLLDYARACNLALKYQEAVDWSDAETLAELIKRSAIVPNALTGRNIIQYIDENDEWDSGYVCEWPNEVIRLLEYRVLQKPKRELNQKIAYACHKHQPTIINSHDCAWFDGGCYTLAVALASIFESSEIYHASKDKDRRDHAVVYVPDLDMYIDANGIQTKQELINNLKVLEHLDVHVLSPFEDINSYPIYRDIVEQLVADL
ncbi:hypothetical protein [Enterovibrio norvegicus]|uniref:hypothetical protein n=1 Tax=Enterovibrio norvegicus TaxID=188144 RepID=UPI00352DDB7C